MTDKRASSFHMANHLKDRKGRRPIRVSTLLKKEKEHLELPASQEKISSESGADLRVPLMGGTKFPTQDSTSVARQQLKAGQKAMELRKPESPTLKDVTPEIKAPTSMPKTGADMTIKNDPLVQYLKKTADALETNLDEMVTGPSVESLQKEDSPVDVQLSEDRCRSVINELFDNSSSMRDKNTSHDYEEGVVDRILKL